MSGVVVLEASEFRGMFRWAVNPPYSDEDLQRYFEWAEAYVSNCEKSLIPLPPRKEILYFTMAHLMTLMPVDGTLEDARLVGNINSGSQGSTSVSVSYATSKNDSAAWWTQTQFGAMAWALIRKYATARAIYGNRRVRRF